MLIRIVRMEFVPEALPAFLALFRLHAPDIRSFAGCLHLELWQDHVEDNVVYTYSHWIDEKSLDAYRQSELFSAVWSETKSGFSARPLVYSLRRTMIVQES